MMPVRLEPAALRSRVKHSTTEPLRSLEDFENVSPYFLLFLQTIYVIEKLLAGFNVQPRIGMNQSLI